MARKPLNRTPGEVDLTDGSDTAPMGPDPDDAILRQIVESAAYGFDDPGIRAASSPRFERDRLRAVAKELLRRANTASRAAQAARRDEESRLP